MYLCKPPAASGPSNLISCYTSKATSTRRSVREFEILDLGQLAVMPEAHYIEASHGVRIDFSYRTIRLGATVSADGRFDYS
jgi:hypothetical protein